MCHHLNEQLSPTPSAVLTTDQRIGGRNGVSSACYAAFHQGDPFSHQENGVSAQEANMSNTTRARRAGKFFIRMF